MYGASAGIAPIQPNKIKLATINQKRILYQRSKLVFFIIKKSPPVMSHKNRSIKIDNPINKTPRPLLGTDFNIA